MLTDPPFIPTSPPQENFCGTSIIVPDLEGVMHLKEDGKKSWKPRLFHLRASGIYYVPKGKSKVRGQKGGDIICGKEQTINTRPAANTLIQDTFSWAPGSPADRKMYVCNYNFHSLGMIKFKMLKKY